MDGYWIERYRWKLFMYIILILKGKLYFVSYLGVLSCSVGKKSRKRKLGTGIVVCLLFTGEAYYEKKNFTIKNILRKSLFIP